MRWSLLLAGVALLGAHACGRSEPATELATPTAASGPASGAQTCSSTEQAWFAGQRAAPLGSTAVLALEQVGDCWVGRGEVDRAATFYRAVKKEFAGQVCDQEGAACSVRATEELRRLACGATWLAPSAQVAWQDFLAALERDSVEPGAARVEPDVRAWDSGAAALDEGCSARAFDLPKSLRADRDRVRREVTSETADWEARSVTIPIRPDDLPWKNYSSAIYRFFHVRSCSLSRPVVGASSGYFIRIAPVESADSDPQCAS